VWTIFAVFCIADHPSSLTEDYNLELQYRKPFLDIWEDENNHPELGPLSERMGVRDRVTGALTMTEEEKDAVSE
jgi:mRNA (guanine-N7-)-methyltransferase